MHKSAIIGLGNIGMEYDVTSSTHPESHTMAYALDGHFQLICAMDVQPEKEQTLHRFSPGTEFYTDLRAMFETHPDIDLVSICTPPKFHLLNLEYLIRQTKIPYIFCEKPLISSVGEMDSFRELLNVREITVVPNLSRRWNPGIQAMREKILSREYGALQKVMVRYTRGIYNTGAHLFDLIRWCGVEISEVQVVDKVHTTSEADGEETFSFVFRADDGIHGYAEAFDDTQYYCFDIAFYFSSGAIVFKYSGDDILYYKTAPHHLYPEFPELKLEVHNQHVLSVSCLKYAIEDWHKVMAYGFSPRCDWQDAVYPLLVARALEESYETGGKAFVREDFLS